MAIHTIRVIKGGRTVLRKQVSEGLGRTDAVVIPAQADALYLLGDTLNNTGPSKITAKRVGKNLQVAIGKGNPDAPDFIIEGYFDFPPAPVAGTLPDGGQAAYDLGNLNAPAVSGSNLPAIHESAATQASLPGEGIGNMGWTIGALVGALALGGGKGGGSSNTPDAATAAQNKITAYANDGTATAPTLADYTAIGVTGVTIGNLAALNSAVDALTSTNVDSKAKLQIVIDAYNKILAEANGAAADATLGSNPLVGDYTAIGANIGTAAVSAASLSLLNDVIGSLTTTAVDTIAEINALAAVVDKVMGAAAGGTGTLTVADLALLGLAVTGAGAATSTNIAAINSAIANAGGTSKVDTLVELSNLVTAIATIVTYADDNTQTAPTLIHYTTVGITGVTVSNLAAINSAVDANAASGVDTKAELQAIVDAYNFILLEANGSAPDATPTQNPTAAQFALIGANIGAAATNSVNLSLLDDAIAGLNSTAVDTVQEINDLAAAANAVMTGAAGGLAPSMAQLALLGITGVTINNIQAIQNAIATTPDSGLQVDTMAELQAIVTTAANAAATSQTLLKNYAASSSNPAPTLADYANIGVSGVDASNRAAINSAIDALTSSGVDTPYQVQSVISAYTKILSEANGAAADATPGVDPTANDFAAIGASVGLASGGIAGGTDLASSALALLDSALGGMSTEQVDTVAEINAIGTVIDAVMNLAKLATGAAIPAGALAISDLALLGVDIHLADTATEVNAILQAIIDSADSGSGVNTLTALQNIVNANAH
ncbi:MAG: hypothetical protein QM533_13595 [Cytophagales bacterium]|nr:hypothetical protein [Cytophagales bacterium]